MNRNVKISKSMAKREVTLVSKCFVVELATLDIESIDIEVNFRHFIDRSMYL